MTIIQKVILLLGTLGVGVLIGWFNGYSTGYEANALPLAELRAQLELRDEEARKKKLEWEKSNENLVIQHDRDVATLRNRLRSAQASGKGSSTPVCPKAPDATSSEPPSGGTPVEEPLTGSAIDAIIREVTIEGCALDAMHVMEFQQWVKEKGFPVSQ